MGGSYIPPRIQPAPFIPPTLEEVEAYCEERKNQIDPVRFMMYYQSRGWKMGNTPMTDWKATIRLWEKRDEEERQKNASAPVSEDNGKYIDPDIGEIRFYENGKLVYANPRLNKRYGADAINEEPVRWVVE